MNLIFKKLIKKMIIKKYMLKYVKAFTLLEILVSSSILWFIFIIIISLYSEMNKINIDIYARTTLVKNTNSLIEKINIIMKNYTIDYEEYFNRKMVWCDTDWWNSFTWDVGDNWYCDNFTAYGNGNNVKSSLSTWDHILYHCSSVENWHDLKEEKWDSKDCEWNNSPLVTGAAYIYSQNNTNALNNGSWCALSWQQSFWEYKLQFWDVNKNVDGKWWCVWDDDDSDLWKWPEAIFDNENVKELYLISKDGKKRIFLRRKLVGSWDFDNDWNVWGTTWEKLYKLQILKLRGFDLWSWHDWAVNWITSKDWQIDTRACDKKEGFECSWSPINWWYAWYKLPSDKDDWRVDFTNNDMNIEDFSLSIYPTKDSENAWFSAKSQISPYISLRLKSRFYPVNYQKKINAEKLMKYNLSVQTIFSINPY